MKKIFISLAFALATLAVNAESVILSTFEGTDMSQYAGQVKDVNAIRPMFKGWNTVSLPFSMTEAQINQIFGSDCRVEKLSGASQNGNTIYLNFVDAKSQGIQANVPYILYYTRETGIVDINVQSVRLDDAPSQILMTTNKGVSVSMNGVQAVREGAGIYGIRAVDNQEAKFVDVSSAGSKFYATRCYLEVSGINNPEIVALHNANNVTGIKDAAVANESNATAYDLSGRKIGQNAKGVRIVNGKKQVVK